MLEGEVRAKHSSDARTPNPAASVDGASAGRTTSKQRHAEECRAVDALQRNQTGTGLH